MGHLSGVAGAFLFRQPAGTDTMSTGKNFIGRKQLIISGIVLLLLLCTLLWGGQSPEAPKDIQILSTFSGISLTLFGGGYVVIPALESEMAYFG